MYIRSLRKPSPNKNVFKFASVKISGVIMCGSTLEFDACNDEIESYGSQPEGFKYEFMGKSLPYNPDTLIIYKNNVEKYHEYKPKSKTATPLFREKFSARRKASLKLSRDLILVTEQGSATNKCNRLKSYNHFLYLHLCLSIFPVDIVRHQ
jgi:hypothetical protein